MKSKENEEKGTRKKSKVKVKERRKEGRWRSGEEIERRKEEGDGMNSKGSEDRRTRKKPKEIAKERR